MLRDCRPEHSWQEEGSERDREREGRRDMQGLLNMVSMDAVITHLFSFLLVCPIPTREQTTDDTV